MTEVAFEKPEKDISVDLPLQPVGWRVLVRPYKPPKTFGDSKIEVPDEALESEELLTYVGQIVAMGNLCFQAVTRAGLNLADIDPKPQVGDWIIYGTYGGQSIKTKDGRKFLVMNDDGIMGVITDPTQFRAYL